MRWDQAEYFIGSGSRNARWIKVSSAVSLWKLRGEIDACINHRCHALASRPTHRVHQLHSTALFSFSVCFFFPERLGLVIFKYFKILKNDPSLGIFILCIIFYTFTNFYSIKDSWLLFYVQFFSLFHYCLSLAHQDSVMWAFSGFAVFPW